MAEIEEEGNYTKPNASYENFDWTNKLNQGNKNGAHNGQEKKRSLVNTNKLNINLNITVDQPNSSGLPFGQILR